MKMNEFGFIVLRHVNNETTNQYWIYCCECIRKLYPETPILIIDDNSDKKYLTNDYFDNLTIINSEYPQRGELLPYYYYLHNKLFEIAIIIHDSVFIHKKLDFEVETFKILWNFPLLWNEPEREISMLNVFKDAELVDFYKSNLWIGCFGGMSIIKHDFLTRVNKKYEISKLLNVVLNRTNRFDFERVIACLLQKVDYQQKHTSMFGIIHDFIPWESKWEEKDNFNNLPIIKIWTSR